MRRVVLLVAVLLAAAIAPVRAEAATPGPHVWIIVLENESSATTFGPNSAAPYLAHTLTAQGAFLRQYYATGHLSLDNYLSMMSGQGPNPQTQSDCQFYTDFVGTGPLAALDGQAVGTGCVYP